MDPRMIPKGQAPEEQGDGRRNNAPGVYYHPQADKFIETTGIRRPDGSMSYSDNDGRIQADAYVQIGYRKANDQEASDYRARQEAVREASRKRSTSTTTVLRSSPRN